MTNSDRFDMFIDAENALRFDGQYRSDAISFIVTRTVKEDQQVSFRAFFKFKSDEAREWTSFNKIFNLTDPVAVADYVLSGNDARPEVHNLNFTHVPDWAKIIPTINWAEDLVIRHSSGDYVVISPTLFEDAEFGRGQLRKVPAAYGTFEWNQDAGCSFLINHDIDLQSYMSATTREDPGIQLVAGETRWLSRFGRVGNEWLPRCCHDRFLMKGDVLIVSNNPSSKSERSDISQYPDGTKLQCVGFIEYTTERDFGGITSEKPRGVYLNRGAALYRVEGGDVDSEPFTYSYSQLVSPSSHIDPKKRMSSVEWKTEKEPVRIGDIPEREFVIGDWVGFKDGSCVNSGFSDGALYDHCEVASTSTTPEGENLFDVRVFQIDSRGKVEAADSRSYIAGDQLELVARGNYYWWLHDKSKIRFNSLAEEAAFYAGLGECVQVRHPSTGLYDPYSLDEQELALDMIRRGEIAVLRSAGGLFGAIGGVTGWRYPNLPDLERRLREETLRGFAAEV